VFRFGLTLASRWCWSRPRSGSRCPGTGRVARRGVAFLNVVMATQNAWDPLRRAATEEE